MTGKISELRGYSTEPFLWGRGMQPRPPGRGLPQAWPRKGQPQTGCHSASPPPPRPPGAATALPGTGGCGRGKGRESTTQGHNQGLPFQTERACCRPRAAQQTTRALQASVWVPPAAGSWAPGAPEGPQGSWPQGALLPPLHPHPHPHLRASGLLESCLGRGETCQPRGARRPDSRRGLPSGPERPSRLSPIRRPREQGEAFYPLPAVLLWRLVHFVS